MASASIPIATEKEDTQNKLIDVHDTLKTLHLDLQNVAHEIHNI